MESRHLNLVELTISCQIVGFVEKHIGAADNIPSKFLVGKEEAQTAFLVVVNNSFV